MTGSLTDYQEEKLLKHLFGIASLTPLGTIHVGVCTGGVTEGGVITGEPTDAAYARVAVTNNGTYWTFSQVAGLSKIVNAADIVFPTASASWGTLTTVFLADAATDGNVLGFITLDESKAIGTNDVFKLLAGALAVTLN